MIRSQTDGVEDSHMSDDELNKSGDEQSVALSQDASGKVGGSGSHKCPECGKVFINKSVLNRHMRVHTGEKPYVCPLCNKAFSQLGNMTKHIKSHENAHLRWDRKTCSKPFKCTYPGCNKSFTAKTSLQSHLLSHQNASLEEESFDSAGESTKKIKREKNPHLAMISSHLRHHHYPNSIIFRDSLPVSSAEAKGSNDTSAELNQQNEIGPATQTSPSQCLHTGCNQVFKSQDELREHLYSYSPGLVAEHQFLINTVLQFSDIISSWDSKSALEKESLKAYSLGVKQAVEKMNQNFIAQSRNQPSSSGNANTQVDGISIAQTDRSESEVASSNNNIQDHSHGHGHINHDNGYWNGNANSVEPIHKRNGQHLYYDPLHTDMDQYFDAQHAPQPYGDHPQSSGAYSNLLHAHNHINTAWGQHSVTSQPLAQGSQSYAGSLDNYSSHHHVHHQRNAMSWEEAIERSQAMVSKGVSHHSIMFNPCHSWEPYNAWELLEDICQDDQEAKRHKANHASENI